MSDGDGLRETGLRMIGAVPWGTHVCLFYHTAEDLLEVLLPYFKAGLEQNELCVWATTEPVDEEQAKGALSKAIPDFDRLLSDGAFEIISGRDFYLADRFDADRIASAWGDKLQNALDRGYEGVRISGNAFWVGTAHWSDFNVYERHLDTSLTGRRMLVACTYCVLDSSAVEMLEVARAHGLILAVRDGEWEFIQSPRPTGPSLTPREIEVLGWVARGKSAREIAQILGIAKRTVDQHVDNAAEKLGASNRTQAVAIAVHDRMIRGDHPE